MYWFDKNTGSRTKSSAQQYNGGRTVEDIVNWINQQLVKPQNLDVKVHEVYNTATYQDKCKGGSLICAIAFLPLVEDSKAEGRNKYIETLLEIQKNLSKRLLDTQIIWMGAQTQPELEKVFGVDSNYPALIVVSNTKDVFVKYNGTLVVQDVTDFVWKVKNRPQGLKEYVMPTLNDATQWDGKDVELEEEGIDEDFLKDLLGETDEKKDL